MTLRSWAAGGPALESKLRAVAQRTGISLPWLRDGRGDTAGEIAKYRPISIDDFESARIAEDAPAELRDSLEYVLKHGSEADRDVLRSVAATLAGKLAQARKVSRGGGQVPPARDSGGGSK